MSKATGDNKDLLDLCRLNLMEETVVDSPAPDRDETLRAIDFKKRQLVTKIARAALLPQAPKHSIVPHAVECAFTEWPVRKPWDNKYCTCSYAVELSAAKQEPK